MKYPFLELKTVNEPYAEELHSAALRVLDSGRYIGGEEVEAFEHRLADIAQTRFAVGVSNGLDALRLILRAYIELGRLSPGDEVIVAANTYIASVLAIVDAGLTPVLAEPSASTSNLDTSRLYEYLSPRTRAIMPVHLYGRVCWDDALAQFANDHNLLVVEDNAQAIGACSPLPGINGTCATGGVGHAAGFSFYPTKNIGAFGDAGAVTTNDPELATAIRALANYGAPTRYHNIYQGFNCRMDSLQAALLTAKLGHIEEENRLRRTIADIYMQGICNPEITLPLTAEEASRLPDRLNNHIFHQFVVHTPDRDRFTAYLDSHGIGWDIHYATPPHLQPCFSSTRSLPHGSLPVTEQLAATCVSLPISRCTSPADAAAIASILCAYPI